MKEILARRNDEGLRALREAALAQRAAMPESAAIGDHWRQWFPDARVRWAKEGGREFGARMPGAAVSAADMVFRRVK